MTHIEKPTLLELANEGIDRAGMTVRDTAMVNRAKKYVNKELKRLHRYLLRGLEDHLVKRHIFELKTDAQSYRLPEDFLRLRKVFLLDSAGKRIKKLERCRLDDLAVGEGGVSAVTNNKSLKYVLIERDLWFHRYPASPGKAEIWHVPQFIILEHDDTTVSYSVPVDWDDFIVEGVAARLLEWEESDSTAQRTRQEEIKAEILGSVEDRDVGEPDRVVDVYNRFGDESDFW